jgi:hypothetical protein
MNKRTNAAIDAVAKYIEATTSFKAKRCKGTHDISRDVLRVSKDNEIYFVEYSVSIYPDDALQFHVQDAHCVGDELPRAAVNSLEKMKNFLLNNRNETQLDVRNGQVCGVSTEDLVEAFLEDVV